MGGVNHVIVHARKAILGKKFSPEDNRRIPPLNYDYVYRLVKDFPGLCMCLCMCVCMCMYVCLHVCLC